MIDSSETKRQVTTNLLMQSRGKKVNSSINKSILYFFPTLVTLVGYIIIIITIIIIIIIKLQMEKQSNINKKLK